jgi:Ca-activated chloride channel homolog
MSAQAHGAPGRALLALILGVLIAPAPTLAQGWIEPDRPGPRWEGVERLRTHVQIRVVDRIAHVEVEEWFRNNGRGLAEGVYLYPLPGEAVFQGYSLFQGDEEFTGETMDAERARAIYEEIVRSRRDPALIELVGHGLLRARVFPFGPGETREITLRYTQVLTRAGDALELRYVAGGPGVMTQGRPGPGPLPTPLPGPRPTPRPGPDAVQPVTTPQEGAPLAFSVVIEDGERFLDPFSPTHTLRVSREGGRILVRPEGELRGRFSLFLPPAGEAVRLSIAAHRPSGGDGYFMLTLSPGQAAASAMPRDLTVVVDVSGSMSGEKIEQTRRAVIQLLEGLEPGDRFRLIRFSSTVESYRPGWTGATRAELAEARRWAEGLRALGGTDIDGALEEAFRSETPRERLPVIVFLTDGMPTVGERNPERIADRADRMRGRARVFAFGVGYDVNTYLLDRLTAAGRGSVQYIEPGEDVEQALSVLAMHIRHPVLTDLELARLPVRVKEVFPREIPDLFQGQELTLFGRYEGTGSGAVEVRGGREGREARFRARVSFPEHTLENDFIPRLWAARKIGELTREARLRGADPELVEEIRETALRYGVLTEYTSHLVLEPGVVAGVQRDLPALVPMPVTAARGVQLARESADARGVRTAAELEDLDARLMARVESEVREGGPAAERRIVAGRAFVLLEGVWTDRLHLEETRTVEVQAFSPAYFALLEAIPELRSWWRELSPVLVAGRDLSLRAGDQGATTLPPTEIRRIVREFRGG